MMRTDELPPLEDVLCHRGSVLLLHEIVEHSDQHTVARVDVSRQSWLKRQDGSVAAWVAIEYMAQCFAAHEGLVADFQNRHLPLGFLIGVHRLRLYVPEIRADWRLRVRTRAARGRPGLGALSHSSSVHTEELGSEQTLGAEGRLSVSAQKPAAS